MALQFRTVVVKQLPSAVNEEQSWAFLEEFKLSLPADRPRIVLNCSNLRAFDRSSLHLLLCCLEEAMKRNGDVRLSSIPQTAVSTLESSGIGNLFKTFDCDADAVKSFQRLPLFAIPEQPVAAQGVSLGADVNDDAQLEATENAA